MADTDTKNTDTFNSPMESIQSQTFLTQLPEELEKDLLIQKTRLDKIEDDFELTKKITHDMENELNDMQKELDKQIAMPNNLSLIDFKDKNINERKELANWLTHVSSLKDHNGQPILSNLEEILPIIEQEDLESLENAKIPSWYFEKPENNEIINIIDNDKQLALLEKKSKETDIPFTGKISSISFSKTFEEIVNKENEIQQQIDKLNINNEDHAIKNISDNQPLLQDLEKLKEIEEKLQSYITVHQNLPATLSLLENSSNDKNIDQNSIDLDNNMIQMIISQSRTEQILSQNLQND